MTYPSASILDERAELQINGAWQDVSSYVFNNDQSAGVAITRGSGDESTSMNPSSANFGFNNADGRFTETNPMSPYYPYLVQNTPIRFSLPEGASYMRSEVDQFSWFSAPDSAGLSITGDTEIQLDITLDNWNSAQILAGKWTVSASQRSWLLLLNEDGTLSFSWSNDGTAIHTAQSTAPVPMPALRRQGLKVTLATATGTVKFFYAPAGLNQCLLGPITGITNQIGASVVVGANTVFDSTSALRLGAGGTSGVSDFPTYAGIYGKIHSFTLKSGIGGTTVASPNFTTATAGASSFADAQANTWSANGTAEISNRRYRAYLETVAFPQSWDPTGTFVMTSVTASGITRRISQSSKPINSALYRYYTRYFGAPVLFGLGQVLAYWPCEDLPHAGHIASGIPGFPDMSVSGGPSLGTDTTFACSDSLPDINSSTWIGRVPGYTPTTTVSTRFLFIPSSTLIGLGGAQILTIDTTGTAGQLIFSWVAGTGFELISSVSGLLTVIGFPATGQPVMVSIELTTSGGNVTAAIKVMDTQGTVNTATAGAFAGSAGIVNRVTVNPNGTAIGNTVIGHITVQNSLVPVSQLAAPVSAYNGEASGIRFQRLCVEEGIAFRSMGQLSVTESMGPQLLLSLGNLLQECIDAERGRMFEPRQVLGLGFRTRYSLSNQAAGVILDYSGADLTGLQPTNDDQNTLNDVTIQRNNGSQSRSVITTGPKSINPPPAGVGRYDTELSFNLQSDAQTFDQAGWISFQGTVNESRFPSIQLDMSRSEIQNVYHDLQEMDNWDFLSVNNVPIFVSPNGISQLLRQQKETIGGRVYQLEWSGLPEVPYETGLVGDAVLGRVDTDGSQLHAGIGTGDTSFLVDVLAGALWITSSVLLLANGSYMPPFSVTSVLAQGVAGGAGGGGSNAAGTKGGGGGGAEYAAEPALGVTPGVSYAVTVGAAGALSGTGTGGNGGNTTIAGDSVTVTAHGGQGGTGGGTGGLGGTGSTNTTHHDGGVGGASPSSADGGGGGGGSGGSAATGNAGSPATGTPGGAGAVAVTGGGPGGAGGAHSAPGSAPPSGPGGGGGGAGGATGGNSGAGSVGQALISWTTADFPFDIVMGGERMTVNSIQNQVSPQTFGVTRSVNGVVKSHSAGEDVRLFSPTIVAM